MEQEMIIMIYSTAALINHNANNTTASQRQIYMHHLNLITPRHDENPLTACKGWAQSWRSRQSIKELWVMVWGSW
jgi:hypothetical protein